MRPRTFDVCRVQITLPENKCVYTAVEVCSILTRIKEDLKKKKEKRAPSINKVICAMKDYKDGSLIPCSLPTIYRILKKFETNPKIEWPVKGRPPVLSNRNFIDTIHTFEKDESRAVSKEDINEILKNAKVTVAEKKGNSTLVVASPTQRLCDNYMSLLPQLEPDRSTTTKVQTKSEGRYIVERNLRNAISHVISVAVSHYQICRQILDSNQLTKLQKVLSYCINSYKMKIKEVLYK